MHRVQDMQRMSGPGQKCSEYASHIPAPGEAALVLRLSSDRVSKCVNHGNGTPHLGSSCSFITFDC